MRLAPPLRLPSLPAKTRMPLAALPLGKGRFELILRTPDRTDLVRKAVKLIRVPGVTEVFATSESGRDARFRVVSSDPGIDLSWLGQTLPHALAISAPARSKGSFARTARGTWQVAMQLIPVVSEGDERARLIEYRGPSGISVLVAGNKLTVGFALEVATRTDGTQICQRAMLNTATQIGVRCEVVPDPGFASLVEKLLAVEE